MAEQPPPPPPDSTGEINVGLIQEPTPPPPADERGIDEARFFARSFQELRLKEYKFEIEARSTYAERLFWLMIVWLATMVALVLAAAIDWPWAGQYVGFELSDTVLITLVTTTTASVLGVL